MQPAQAYIVLYYTCEQHATSNHNTILLLPLQVLIEIEYNIILLPQ